MGQYIFLGAGIWLLYSAWKGVVPVGGPKKEVGQPMRTGTRFLFIVGGMMLTGVGIVLWIR